jgi:SagB-type dehydrogenase family enzyme
MHTAGFDRPHRYPHRRGGEYGQSRDVAPNDNTGLEMNDKQSARRLHESTKHGTPPPDPQRLVEYRRLDPRNAPRPFKKYTNIGQIPLPRGLVTSSLPATAVLSGKRGEQAGLDSSLLATLLFLSAGVTRTAGPPGRRIYFRAAMSAGNLHPIEVYPLIGDDAVVGIDAGVYHFDPLEFALTPLRHGDHRRRLGVEAPLAMVLTGIPWRTTWKYAERGWRHLYWDSGTMVANLLAVADAHGLAHRTRFGFEDVAVNELVGIDGHDEMPLAIVDIGPNSGVEESSLSELEPLSVDVPPVAPRPLRLPLLQEAQAGSELDDGDVGSWLQAGSAIGQSALSEVESPLEAEEPIEEIILRRGSTRRMVHQTVARDRLDWPMAAATRAVGTDVVSQRTLLDHYVNVHAVEGLDPGAYHVGENGSSLIRKHDNLRERSAGLCLGQPLGGDSCYTVFHCADLDSFLGSLGSRGYRVAQFESGVVSGRLALCAFAVGLGATGLTFFDDPVSQHFATPAEPMLVTSVGVPVSSPAPAGQPGHPAPLQT